MEASSHCGRSAGQAGLSAQISMAAEGKGGKVGLVFSMALCLFIHLIECSEEGLLLHI